LVRDFEGESDVREFGDCNAGAASGPTCGNSIIEQGEECDDGNSNNQDACTNQCQLARCGDTIVQVGAGEECDDGNSNNQDGCTNQCQFARCGDGFRGPGEECDNGDANNSNTGTCTITCRNSRCGDGFVQPGEGCDEGDQQNSNTGSCTRTCQPARCGDNLVQAGVEDCDDGNTSNGDGCSSSCQIESPVCGNGVVEQGEQCDNGNNDDNGACTLECTTARCGDQHIYAGVEQCDFGDLLNNDNGECTSDCQRARCGDNFVQSGNGEECDDGNNRNGDGCSVDCQIESTASTNPTTSCTGNLVRVQLEMTPDRWSASENHYYLYDFAANEFIWLESLGQIRPGVIVDRGVCLDPIHCYGFEFYDAWGDGLISRDGLKLYYDGQLILDIKQSDWGIYWNANVGTCI
jgi:cysteine-rich repeat protein